VHEKLKNETEDGKPKHTQEKENAACNNNKYNERKIFLQKKKNENKSQSLKKSGETLNMRDFRFSLRRRTDKRGNMHL
jgi:hypothetical protein